MRPIREINEKCDMSTVTEMRIQCDTNQLCEPSHLEKTIKQMLNVHYNTISHYTFKQLNNFFHLVKYKALKFCCVRNEKRVAK